MRAREFGALLIGYFLSSQLALTATPGGAKFDPYNPPFYTMTYEEITGFPTAEEAKDEGRPDQKGIYLRRLLQSVRELTSSPTKSFDFHAIHDVKDLSPHLASAEAWNDLRAAIFYACEDRSLGKEQFRRNLTVCARMRKDVLDVFALGSADHRHR